MNTSPPAFTRLSALLLLLVLLIVAAACDSGAPPTPASVPGTSGGQSEGQGQPEPTAIAGAGDSNSQGDRPGKYKLIDLSGVDQCALITREAAEALMGPLDWDPNPNSGVEGSAVGTRTCTYDPAFMQDSQMKALIINLWPADSWLISDPLEGKNVKLLSPAAVGLGSDTFPKGKFDYLPPVCGTSTPCVLTNDTIDWQFVYAILPDRTAVTVKVFPKSVENAVAFTRMILEQPPFK